MKNVHSDGDLNWIVGQLFRFCRKNAWEMVHDVVKNVQAEYVWRKLTMATDTKENLDTLIAKAAEFGIKEVVVPEVSLGKTIHKLSIHPNGKVNILSRAEVEKRRMANRAERLSKQPNKGKSDPVDKHGGKGAKNKGK
jgi:hypothetical protein